MLAVPVARPRSSSCSARSRRRSRRRSRFASAEPVVCREWEEGMAASLRCGVAEIAGEADWAVVTLGDQPARDARGDRGRDGRRRRRRRRGPRDVRRRAAATPSSCRGRLLDRVPSLHGDVGARDLLRDARVRRVEARHLRARTTSTPPRSWRPSAHEARAVVHRRGPGRAGLGGADRRRARRAVPAGRRDHRASTTTGAYQGDVQRQARPDDRGVPRARCGWRRSTRPRRPRR